MTKFLKAGLILGMLWGAACGHRYYAVDYNFYRKDFLPPLEISKFRLADLDVIAKSTTVAFAPPSQCKDIAVGDSKSEARYDLLYTDCGALMSELESAAHSAGYDVISWKSIKETKNDSLEQRLKEKGVDLLIEVNRIAVHKLRADSFAVGEIMFFEDFPDGHRKSLAVNNDKVGKLCREKISKLQEVKYRAVAILDVKVIDARAGRVISRQVHMWPNRYEGRDVQTEYYYGTAREPPENIICVEDPTSPDWHTEATLKEEESKQKDKPAEQTKSGIFVMGQNQTAEPEILTLVLQKTAKKFINTLVFIREMYMAPVAPVADKEKLKPNKPTPHKGKGKSTNIDIKGDMDKKAVELSNEAHVDYDRGDYEKAVSKYKEAIRIKSTLMQAYYFLGEALLAQAKCTEAIEYFKIYYHADKDAKSKDPDSYTTLAADNIKACEQAR